MNVHELRRAMDAAGHGAEYALSDVAPEPGDGLGSNVTVVEPVRESTRWTVYFTERGAIIDQRFFATEADACAEALAQLQHDVESRRRTGRSLSDEELAQARAAAETNAREYREALIAKGMDPDTFLPLQAT